MAPANAMNVIRQWLDIHGLPMRPMSEGLVNGYPHQVWWNGDGDTIVEFYSITDMAHGTPLGMADNDEPYGAAGAHMIEAGISSSYRIAEFFGLTDAIRQPKPSPEVVEPDVLAVQQPNVAVVEHEPAAQAYRAKPRPAIDINAVITRALTAAGLMK